jgi:hypothetical protein
MRARNLKPGLFKNEILGAADPLYTLVFEGLWCMADKAGRLEDRPLRIHAEVNPYRPSASTVQALDWLVQHRFMIRYEAAGQKYLAVRNFGEHQQPHIKEAVSKIPAPSNQEVVEAPVKTGASTEVAALTPDSGLLIPDSGVRGAARQPGDVPRLPKLSKPAEPDWMPAFRRAYPRRSGSQRWESARRHAVKRLAEGHTVAEIMAGVERYAAYCAAESILGRREVQQAATFLGDDKGFLEPWTPSPPKLNGHKSTERQHAAETEARNWDGWKRRAAKCGCRDPFDGESLSAYIAEVEQHESRRRTTGPQSAASLMPQLVRS